MELEMHRSPLRYSPWRGPAPLSPASLRPGWLGDHPWKPAGKPAFWGSVLGYLGYQGFDFDIQIFLSYDIQIFWYPDIQILIFLWFCYPMSCVAFCIPRSFFGCVASFPMRFLRRTWPGPAKQLEEVPGPPGGEHHRGCAGPHQRSVYSEKIPFGKLPFL